MILITGSSGFVGREIVRQLREAGHKVRLLAHKKIPNEDLGSSLENFQIVRGSVLDLESLKQACAGVQAVIHLVGIISEKRGATFEKIHVQGTQNVLTAMAQTGVRRLLHMSALGARPQASTRYHQTKWEAEELVRQSNLDWTVFRPSVIYGPGDSSIRRFAMFLKPPLDFLSAYTMPNLGGGTFLLQPIHVEEVAFCFCRALANEKAVRQAFELCGPAPVCGKELLGLLAQKRKKAYVFEKSPLRPALRFGLWTLLGVLPLLTVASVRINLLGVLDAAILGLFWIYLLNAARRWKETIFFDLPFFLLKPAAWIFEKLLPFPLLTTEQLAMLQENNTGDPKPAMRAFGFKPRSLESGLVYLEDSVHRVF